MSNQPNCQKYGYVCQIYTKIVKGKMPYKSLYIVLENGCHTPKKHNGNRVTLKANFILKLMPVL